MEELRTRAFQWDGTETCFLSMLYDMEFKKIKPHKWRYKGGNIVEWYDGMPWYKKVPVMPMYGLLLRDDGYIEVVDEKYFEEE